MITCQALPSVADIYLLIHFRGIASQSNCLRQSSVVCAYRQNRQIILARYPQNVSSCNGDFACISLLLARYGASWHYAWFGGYTPHQHHPSHRQHCHPHTHPPKHGTGSVCRLAGPDRPSTLVAVPRLFGHRGISDIPVRI